jgi:hypothetical protein
MSTNSSSTKQPARIDCKDLGVDWQDAGPWRSFDLTTHGETLEEMRANAAISEVDQDGGELCTYGLEECSSDVERAVEREIHHALGLKMLKEAT